jgi:hypothetical protein
MPKFKTETQIRRQLTIYDQSLTEIEVTVNKIVDKFIWNPLSEI